jgi:hypothetical protein
MSTSNSTLEPGSPTATPGTDEAESPDAATLMRALVSSPALASANADAPPGSGLVVAELLGLSDEGRIAFVRWNGQRDSAAMRARSVVDLHGAHVGHSVVLMFENGQESRPIVMGVLRGEAGWPIEERPGQIEVFGDGERLIVSAKDQLVLRCGTASITLTKAGKVLIEGEYVSSRSKGVNRIKGGSVQLN